FSHLEDLSGQWEGVWSWDHTQRSTIEIDKKEVKVLNFPVSTVHTNLVVANEIGEVAQLGDLNPQEKPSLLIRLDQVGVYRTLFIEYDIFEGALLVYHTNVVKRRSIKFKKVDK